MDLDIASGSVTHNGGRLYWEAGGAGSPVVLVHGMTLDTHMWDDQFSVLDQWNGVIQYDARCYRKSSPPSGPANPSDDLAATLDVTATVAHDRKEGSLLKTLRST